MIFSQKFKQSNQLCAFSPDGNYLAHACGCRLVIRRFNTQDVIQSREEGGDDTLLYICADNVTYIEWSPDSEYVLCALQRKALIQVWSIADATWTCKLNHGTFGLTASRWAPDSRHILSASDFKLRITVWSLINKSVSHIEYPKYTTKGLAYTNDGKYMAVGERRDYQDNVCLFSCDTWHLLTRFPVDTNDMADMKFSPSGYMLAIWDSKVEYKVVVYSLDGRVLFSYSANDIALLGVKTVSWCPSNQYLFIGSYDQQVRVINTTIWKPVCNMAHVSKVTNADVLVYEEVGDRNDEFDPTSDHFVIHDEPVQLTSIRPDTEKPNPKLGVGTITCCHDSSYMATKNDNMPNVIWIWNTTKLELDTVLMFTNTVKTLAWHPHLSHLAICTGTDKLYIWCPQGCLSVPVPDIDDVIHVSWHVTGDALLLMGKDKMCVSHFNSHGNNSLHDDGDEDGDECRDSLNSTSSE